VFVAEILDRLRSLIRDQYGNYVVQHVAEFGKPEERERVLSAVRGNVLAFSRHKFASNVVEKCMRFGDAHQRYDLVAEVISGDPGASGGEGAPLRAMMTDAYANYVVQTMVKLVDGAQRAEMVRIIEDNIHALEKLSFGDNVAQAAGLSMRYKSGGMPGYGAGGKHSGKRYQTYRSGGSARSPYRKY
jgi:pumilio RNA-binding family